MILNHHNRKVHAAKLKVVSIIIQNVNAQWEGKGESPVDRSRMMNQSSWAKKVLGYDFLSTHTQPCVSSGIHWSGVDDGKSPSLIQCSLKDQVDKPQCMHTRKCRQSEAMPSSVWLNGLQNKRPNEQSKVYHEACPSWLHVLGEDACMHLCGFVDRTPLKLVIPVAFDEWHRRTRNRGDVLNIRYKSLYVVGLLFCHAHTLTTQMYF